MTCPWCQQPVVDLDIACRVVYPSPNQEAGGAVTEYQCRECGASFWASPSEDE